MPAGGPSLCCATLSCIASGSSPAAAPNMAAYHSFATAQEFRHRVRSALGKAGVDSPFTRDALEDAGARHGPPFAVVCSGQMDLEVGRWAHFAGCGLTLRVNLRVLLVPPV